MLVECPKCHQEYTISGVPEEGETWRCFFCKTLTEAVDVHVEIEVQILRKSENTRLTKRQP